MIRTQDLEFQYGSGPSFRFPDMECQKGEQMLILGESGSGKTTLLHLLAGMLKARRGTVHIDGCDIEKLENSRLDKFRGEKVGIVFQTAHFVESLDVEDNLVLPQFLAGHPINRKHVRLVLDRLGLLSKKDSKPSRLSVGEAQRAAIARAVVNNPSVILADEPTSALDDRNTESVITLLEEQARTTGATLIIVTHDKRLKDRFNKNIQL